MSFGSRLVSPFQQHPHPEREMVEPGFSRRALKTNFEQHRHALTSLNFVENMLPYVTLTSMQAKLASLQDDLYTKYENIERIMYFRMLDELSEVECIDLLGAAAAAMAKSDEFHKRYQEPPATEQHGTMPPTTTIVQEETEEDAINALLAPSTGANTL
jgi:hypothetical protein